MKEEAWEYTATEDCCMFEVLLGGIDPQRGVVLDFRVAWKILLPPWAKKNRLIYFFLVIIKKIITCI
jgi:hypothetical protein